MWLRNDFYLIWFNNSIHLFSTLLPILGFRKPGAEGRVHIGHISQGTITHFGQSRESNQTTILALGWGKEPRESPIASGGMQTSCRGRIQTPNPLGLKARVLGHRYPGKDL